MQGNLAMMNWAQIRLSSPPRGTLGPQTAVLAGGTWSFPEMNCHTTKIKHLTFCDEEFPGRVIKGEPESRFLADEERERAHGEAGNERQKGLWCHREEESAVLIHWGTKTPNAKSLPGNKKSNYARN